MAIGDVRPVTAGRCTDLYYVDTGMYETSGYGVVYILDGDRPALIETGIGTDHELVLEALETVGIERDALEAIVVTHVHLDHAGGAGFVAAACPNADVYVPAIGAPHLADPSKLVAGTKAVVGDLWDVYTEPVPVPEARLCPIDDGDTVDLGDHDLLVHAAPGHAPHQVVYEVPTMDAVFTGDAAGIWIPAQNRVQETSPPAQFNLEQCLADVETLQAIDPDVLLYTHCGPREVGEKAGTVLETYAETLTAWVDAVKTKRETLTDDAVVAYFVDRVETADVWGERKARAETRMNVEGVLAYLEWLEREE